MKAIRAQSLRRLVLEEIKRLESAPLDAEIDASLARASISANENVRNAYALAELKSRAGQVVSAIRSYIETYIPAPKRKR